LSYKVAQLRDLHREQVKLLAQGLGITTALAVMPTGDPVAAAQAAASQAQAAADSAACGESAAVQIVQHHMLLLTGSLIPLHVCPLLQGAAAAQEER